MIIICLLCMLLSRRYNYWATEEVGVELGEMFGVQKRGMCQHAKYAITGCTVNHILYKINVILDETIAFIKY